LALGFSGGIGMLSAGLLGGPGIGYKQDYFAKDYLVKNNAQSTYSRYKATKEDGTDDTKGFPLVSDIVPERVEPVAGLDNGKLKVLDDYTDVQVGKKEKTTLQTDLDDLKKKKEAGEQVDAKLEQNLDKMNSWWNQQVTGSPPHYEADKKYLDSARLYGKRTALLYTAAVPATMAVGFLLLWLLFLVRGGYKQVHIEGEGQEAPVEY
jgi:hypothetical protein